MFPNGTPKSGLRYRPISAINTTAVDVAKLNIPPRTSARRTSIGTQTRQRYTDGSRLQTWSADVADQGKTGAPNIADIQDEDEEASYATRLIPHRRAARQPVLQTDESLPRPHQPRRVHWLLLVGVGMLAAFILYIGVFHLYLWGLDIHNDWTYGSTRTTNFDAVVGDHDSTTHKTHLIGINLNGSIEIIELPGGDVAHGRAYSGPHLTWPDAAKAVISFSVADVNHDGEPDIIVTVTGDPVAFGSQPYFQFVLLHTKDGFKPEPAMQ